MEKIKFNSIWAICPLPASNSKTDYILLLCNPSLPRSPIYKYGCRDSVITEFTHRIILTVNNITSHLTLYITTPEKKVHSLSIIRITERDVRIFNVIFRLDDPKYDFLKHYNEFYDNEEMKEAIKSILEAIIKEDGNYRITCQGY